MNQSIQILTAKFESFKQNYEQKFTRMQEEQILLKHKLAYFESQNGQQPLYHQLNETKHMLMKKD